MSDLIVLPGQSTKDPSERRIFLPGEAVDVSEGFIPSKPEDLIGRRLTYNPVKIRKFATQKFYIGPAHPVEVVVAEADLSGIFQAFYDGRLLDVTNDSSMTVEGAAMSPVKTLDMPDAPRAFLGTDKEGNVYVAVPPSVDEEPDYVRQIQEKKRIDGHYSPQVGLGDVMMTSISVTDIEPRDVIGTQRGFWALVGEAFKALWRKLTKK